jgi:HEAT repeat protein
MEPRFVAQVLTRIGPESLAGVVEIAQDADPIVRERAVDALEAIGERDGCRETVVATLEQLVQDPDPRLRAAASQARHALDR